MPFRRHWPPSIVGASAAMAARGVHDDAGAMGCPTGGCAGYELSADRDFDTNGNGRTIANLYINDGHLFHAGLFGIVGPGGIVRNVGLTAPNADSQMIGRWYVGALTGDIERGRVSGVWSDLDVSGRHMVGGRGRHADVHRDSGRRQPNRRGRDVQSRAVLRGASSSHRRRRHRHHHRQRLTPHTTGAWLRCRSKRTERSGTASAVPDRGVCAFNRSRSGRPVPTCRRRLWTR